MVTDAASAAVEPGNGPWVLSIRRHGRKRRLAAGARSAPAATSPLRGRPAAAIDVASAGDATETGSTDAPGLSGSAGLAGPAVDDGETVAKGAAASLGGLAAAVGSSALRPDPGVRLKAAPGALRLPATVRAGIFAARESAGLSRAELSEISGLPVDRLADLEDGTTVQADPMTVLDALRRLAPAVGLHADRLVAVTVAVWSAAYARGDPELGGPVTAPIALQVPAAGGPGRTGAVVPGRLPVGETDGGASRGGRAGSAHRWEGSPHGWAGSATSRELRKDRWEAGSASWERTGALPVVGLHGARRDRRPRRLPRVAVTVAMADVAAMGLLLAAHAGLLDSSSHRLATERPAGRHLDLAGASLTYRAVQVASGVTELRVAATTFTVQVVVTRPCWVQIQVGSAVPVVAGVIAAGATPIVHVQAPVTVVIGAGGTSVRLLAGSASAVFDPSAAPVTLHLVPVG